ncbi:Acetyltransferase (GNAT) family protein [compost metagenome]
MEHTFEILIPTINNKFEPALAQPEDTEEIMSLLVETAEWLRSRGSSQWEGLLEGNDSHDTVGAILRRNVFVFKQGTEIAGLVMLLQKPSQWDVHLWEDKAQEDDGAVYLHRLAVRRKYARTGLGHGILNWCSTGVRFANKRLIRLDCVAENDTLNSFYTRNGYLFVGEKEGFNTYESKYDNE